ncbi:MAG: stalk domain-containing protein [Bacillota bacterium]|nr:stalk domain-containing protein [Bacillota bacterium]
MKKIIKLMLTILVAAAVMQLSVVSVLAAGEKEFCLEQAAGYSQGFTVTNVLESTEGVDTDFNIKAQVHAKMTCDFIFSNIKINYGNEEYSDESGKPISSIVKESGKVIIPDGPVIPQHYDTGYTIEFDKAGHYSLEISYSDFSLVVFIDIVEGMDNLQQNADDNAIVNVPALPTSSKILVNGTKTMFEAYTINGNNYFKLRDLAKVVSGTDKQFEVSWDGSKNAINLISNKIYTAVGGEMEVNADSNKQNAVLSTAKIYIDGQEAQLSAYTINGNNYFRLRDIAKAFDIGITWNGEASTIGIDTSISYME